MFCISVSFKKTPLEIRQQFAFREEEQIAFLSALIQEHSICGGVVLSTCNRSEFYFSGEPLNLEAIQNAIAAKKQLPREYIKKYCLYYQGSAAVRHLYKVSCGLDSMVLGEDEILRQVKEAYLLADRERFTNGELNIIFQGAFNAAKLSKSETRLSNTPVSIGTLTANRICEYLKANVTGRARVLVIGATGKIGSIVAKDLIAKGVSVIGTSRSRERAESSFTMGQGDCSKAHANQMDWLNFDCRYQAVAQANVIVSATSSPHYTLTKEEFQNHRLPEKYLLIDLAVPYDMDRELAGLAGVTLLDIDYFKEQSRENSNIKLGEMDKAERILEECMEETLKKLYIREFQEKLAQPEQPEWFRKMTYYLRDVLDSEQLQAVLERIYEQEIQHQ
jgi:glutamyl-tRNA reductase